MHSKFLVDLALFSFLCSNLICCWSAEDGGGCPPLLPDSFSDRPRNYNDLNLPVDSVYDSSDPDEKTLMVVAIFRLNVKSSRCQSHAGDISIFLEGQAFAANAPVAWCSFFVWRISPPQGPLEYFVFPTWIASISLERNPPVGEHLLNPHRPPHCHHAEDAALSPEIPTGAG